MTAFVSRPTAAGNSVFDPFPSGDLVTNINEGILDPASSSDSVQVAALPADIGTEQLYTFTLPTTIFETINNITFKALSQTSSGTAKYKTRLEINGDWQDYSTDIDTDTSQTWDTRIFTNGVDVTLTSLRLAVHVVSMTGSGILWDEIYLVINGDLVGPGCLAITDEALTSLAITDQALTNLAVTDQC